MEHPIRAIRRAGVPLVCFETADPLATQQGISKNLNGKTEITPLMKWDIINGLVGINPIGEDAVRTIAPNGPIESGNPAECLKLLAEKAPEETICFFSNAHRFIDNESVSQAIFNLRDIFKGRHACLVLTAPSIRLPAELKNDIVVINEPLPDTPEIRGIVDSIMADAGLDSTADDTVRAKMSDTLLGLSAFSAEQTIALSLTKEGVNMPSLWERKRKMVEQTPGLEIFRGNERFEDLGGLANLKTFLGKILTSGRTPVRAIGFLDEIEKAIGGSQGDMSGVSQDQLRVLLTEMQDSSIPGIILVGPPGTGKSAIAKASGNVAGAEVVSIDLGAMTGSLVGESQAKIRQAMSCFKAISQGKAIIIATCNRIASLPPELKRRFSLGTFYVDLPSSEELETIWPIWIKRYGLAEQERPDCLGWTGAEIRAVCDVAYRADISLIEAAKFIVPVCKSASDSIEALRKQADGRFISANYPGVYQFNKTANAPVGRKITL